jgi:DinB superfamily
MSPATAPQTQKPRAGREGSRSHARWETACDEHRVALAAYLDAAAELDDEAWTRPWAPEKWTPAQVTEHLTLSYEAALQDLQGRPMAVRFAPWRLRLTRWILLPHILFHRTFPLRAPAPRELRPKEPRAPRPEALELMRGLGERFEQEMERAWAAGGGHLTHPYFGAIEPVKAMRFFAVHLEHHRRQVASAKA